MNYGTEDIVRQLRLGEDSRWEFKEIAFRGDRPHSSKRDSLANELAAFANGHGGVLLCGVTDAGEVQGMTREQLDATERLIFQICADSILPAIEIDVRRFEIDDKALLSIAVPAGYPLHDSPGGTYRRVGSSARKMTSDERLRLAQRRGQARFLMPCCEPRWNANLKSSAKQWRISQKGVCRVARSGVQFKRDK